MVGLELFRPPSTMSARARARLGFLVLLAACAAVRVSGARAQIAVQGRAFDHTKHVSHFWTDEFDPKKSKGNPEYARDCRGCHDYSKPVPRDPQAVCRNCHVDDKVGGFALATKPGYENGFIRNPSSAYSHADHLSLACRQCHAPAPGDKDDYVGSVGIGACNACHASATPPKLEMVMVDQGGAAALSTLKNPNWQQGFLDALNANPRMKADGRSSFRHRDHMARSELGSKEACQQCHASVATAAWNTLAQSSFETSNCGSCHVGANGTPLTVTHGARSKATDRATASTFSHSDHLKPALTKDAQRNCAGAVFGTIESDGCLACHVHEDKGAQSMFALRPKRGDYAGCITCHDVERFKTKDHGKWDTCTGCHAIGEGDMKSQRKLVSLDRVGAGSVRFVMPPQQHPGIAGKPAQACAECHRASVPSLPTRIVGAQFDHAPHLPPKPTAADCAKCHDDLAKKGVLDGIVNIGAPWTETSPKSGDLARALTFDMTACGACHPGIALDERQLATRTALAVPAFSHKAHLDAAHFPDRKGPLVSCTTCHGTEAAQRGKLLGTLPAALDCTLCHSHDDERAAWTGDLRGSDVTSCQVCHADRMPKPGARPALEVGSALLGGCQVHARGQNCTECHRSARDDAPLATLDVVVATGAIAKRHPSNDSRPADCFACHWGVVNKSISADVPDVAKRALLGWNMTCFPGGSFGNPNPSGACPEQPR